MDNGTNEEQPISGEASSSRPKRQRLVSMEIAEGTPSGDVMARSGKLFELDLLDCPICYHPLRSPIFQCVNGHIACSSCCIQMEHKCPSCPFPIGNFRSRIMEKVVEAVMVPCPNTKQGCNKMISYDKESTHEKECIFTLCYCPVPNCNYTGRYKDLYGHYSAIHKTHESRFTCHAYYDAHVVISEKILAFQENEDGPLVVVQCFREPKGMYVTVSCIAPCAPGVGEFSYLLIYRRGIESLEYHSKGMNRIQKVSFETPKKNYMLIPYYILDDSPILEIQICIRPKGEERSDNEDEEEEE